MPHTAPRHFLEVIRHHALTRGDALAYRFVRREAEVDALTFSGLDRAACALAAALADRAKERALLLFPPGLEFVRAFVGCWYAGVVPVPCAPPTREHEVQRLMRIVSDAGVRVVLTVEGLSALVRAKLDQSGLAHIACLETESLRAAPEAPWRDPGVSPETIALLQYTSGSTSEPKGVVISHANLAHNQQSIARLFEHDQDTSVVGWLPLYHDMGLIGNVLQPLWLGRPVTLMSPLDFMMKPLSWLRTISKYRATTSGGPNFAYELCAEAATAEDVASLDLSCWTLAYNGAEPIRKATLDRFVETFAPAGLQREAIYPCYGLAESTLIVTGARKREPFLTRDYDRDELTAHRARRADASTKARTPLASCGAPAEGTTLCIVDPETRRPLDDGRVGEIWVSSPSVAVAYWQQPEATEEALRAHLADRDGAWLRTGDLGFLDEGELFIAGRLKDLIIVRGRNHHPQDIEETCWTSHPALRVGRAAAFTLDETSDEERLVVVQEVQQEPAALDLAEVTAQIRASVARKHGLGLYDVVLARSGQVPKTSSGKVRRRACKKLYTERALKTFAPSES